MVRTLIFLPLIRIYPNLFVSKLGRVARYISSFTNKNILTKARIFDKVNYRTHLKSVV